MSNLITSIVLLTALVSFGQQDRLAIFTDLSSDHPSIRDFNNNYLDSLVRAMGSMDVKADVIDASKGLPSEVKSLPALYFLHDGKLNYFKGRYSNIERIQTFVSSQRAFGFGSSALTKKDLFVWEQNGFAHGIVVKKYPVAGDRPGLDHDAYFEQLMQGLEAGFQNFKRKASYDFGDQSKLFYLLMYPYATGKNKNFITVQVLSQHSCKVHVFSNLDTPYEGKDPKKIAQEIGIFFEDLHAQLMKETHFHDGLLVGKTYPEKGWEDLGFTISTAAAGDIVPGGPVPSGTYATEKSDAITPVSFAFPPPVSQYAGTFPELKGTFYYKKGQLSGSLFVDAASMDMGEEILNESVLGEQLLSSEHAQLKVKFDASLPEFNLNEKNAVDVELDITGITKNEVADVEIRALEEEDMYLLIATLGLDIRPFPTLEQPDGPDPQRHTIQIRVVNKLRLSQE